jgi:hypothetical protein
MMGCQAAPAQLFYDLFLQITCCAGSTAISNSTAFEPR